MSRRLSRSRRSRSSNRSRSPQTVRRRFSLRLHSRSGIIEHGGTREREPRRARSHSRHRDNHHRHHHHQHFTRAKAREQRRRTPSPSSSPSVSSSRSASSLSEGSDAGTDKEGLIHIYPGEYIRDRYKVLGLAGQGTFGTVLDVLDTKYNDRLALKVVRSVKRYLEAAETEIDILNRIQKADVNRNSGCVRLYCTFEFRHRGNKHVCLGFEKLGRSLYEFIKHNRYRGFEMNTVREFAQQLLKAVAFCHSIRLVHTDLKPENILLATSDYYIIRQDEKSEKDYRIPVSSEIRLIDFGGATFENDHHATVINTRQYRSPEVLLGLGWSYPSDLWSVGCILAELATGELLFNTHDDLEHLALMQKTLGVQLPRSMTMAALRPYVRERDRVRDRTRQRSARDNNGRRFNSSNSSSNQLARRSVSASPIRGRGGRGRSRSRSRRDASHSHSASPSPSKRRGGSNSQPRADKLLHFSDGTLRFPEKADRESRRHVSSALTLDELFPSEPDFVNLLRRLLAYEPSERITAVEALQHPFLHRHKSSSSSSSSSSSTSSSSQRIS